MHKNVKVYNQFKLKGGVFMNNFAKNFRDYLFISFGVFLVASGLYFFLMPNNIAAGGVNGLAMVVNHYIPVMPIGSLMFIMNIILFVVAFIFIGSTFGARTIYSSFLLTGMIWVMEYIYPHNAPFTNDPLLELFFGIGIQGAGMAIIFNKNASTGGTDIIAKILNKFFHVDLGKGVLLSDLSITVMAIFAFDLKLSMYAMLGVIINGFVIDGLIEGINMCKEVTIISDKYEEIKRFVLDELGRGTTIYKAMGGFTDKDKNVIVVVVGRRDFYKIKNFVNNVDKNAFITVNNVYEVFGDGFKSLTH